jgi:hypothetical protein
VRLTADLDQVRKQLDARRDDVAHVSAELQGFIDANQEALKALAAAGNLAPRTRKK